MRHLIIHPKDQTTDFLKEIYAHINYKTVIDGNVSKAELIKLIDIHDQVLMLGHGSPIGLFSKNQFTNTGSYIIDESVAGSLRKKTNNVFIWCHADKFVERNRLEGFYSGMFISEVGEAFSWGYYISNRNLIQESNERFASIVSKHIHQPLDELYENVIQEYGALAQSNQIAKFNMERLFLSKRKSNSVWSNLLRPSKLT
ncbi:MAG: hypothetical protein PHP53_23595 [Prolixibacteraceae bacterium]|nr:hypothetical protein [Prolixibacteraceae bacterium]